MILIAVSGLACGKSHSDEAFATPEATLMTLLRTHHLDKAPQGEIRKRLGGRDLDRPGPTDLDLMDQCFEDFDRDNPLHHGLAGFVVGAVAAKRDDLRVRIEGETARVETGGPARIVLHHNADGWRISLGDSVPRAYQERMQGLYDQAKRQGGESLLRGR